MNEDEKIRLRERLVMGLLQSGKHSDDALKAAEKIYSWVTEGPAKKNTE